jgi:hypothetical protein
MRRVLVILIAAAAMTVGLAAGTASADVHGISQAACGASPNAGAIVSRDRGGRPDAPIPVSASPVFTLANFPGQGGAAGAPCPNR